ncbi:class I SAM-dependent methyltransferase [bacterium]|nr:class I SAM-dependent methyltransferase [bacterium]
MSEDVRYKHDDYSIRSQDSYAHAKYEIVLKWLPQTPNLRVLNAGCGSGEMNILLARQTTWQVDGIDLDEEAIQRSQQLKEAYKATNLHISQAGIETHPGRDYDVIIANDVLEHIEDDRAAIRHLAAMLKPNGTLCVSVPALQWLFGHHDHSLGHFRRYNKALLTSRLAPVFNVEKCRYFAATLIPIAILYSRILQTAYPVAEGSQNPITGRILHTLFEIEKTVALPIGTSLLALATRK